MKNILVRLLRLLRLYSLAVIVVRTLYWQQEHAEKLKRLRFYRQFINEGDLCFDIGANLGNRTEIFRKLGANIIAVEPQRSCVAGLKRRYRKDKKVRIVQKAIGAHEGEITIAICTKDNEKSSCSAEWINVAQTGGLRGFVWDRRVQVQMTTIDKLIEEFGIPSFCKIDTEGFEYECVKGLSHPIKALSLEFHLEYTSPTINAIHRLAEIGLAKYNYSIAESMKWALPRWVGADEICKVLENHPGDKYAYGDVYATI